MQLSRYFLPMLKETPADAELVSHRLMLRAGLIRKLASGIYTWLPLGQRVLDKVKTVVREEMNAIDGLEITMPSVQPSKLWQESHRWDKYGAELLRFSDRHQRDFCYGPTHEEVIVDTMRGELRSYKQLPMTVYQIQTKFRDEIRPRFGVMRAREFLMKDAYSFHMDQDCMGKTYEAMFGAYSRIFQRLGLKYRAVLADSGAIGGNFSHEFQVLADSGEDVVVYSDQGEYAANLERAQAKPPAALFPAANEALVMEKFQTPGVSRIEDLQAHGFTPEQTVKTLIVRGDHAAMVALVLRGDHTLNPLKAEKIEGVASPLEMVAEDEVKQQLGVGVGSLGPVGLSLTIVVDNDAAALVHFVCGANEEQMHCKQVNWQRDCKAVAVADLRMVVEGDAAPEGEGRLQFCKGIEVGHIFQLGDVYSSKMGLTVLNEGGKARAPLMGCYGIGVSRIIAAAIEQSHDDKGIIWPAPMAPFQVAIVPLQMHKSFRVKELTDKIYQQLKQAGVEVLLDDRKERTGVMFATMDLIGIPHRLIIGDRGIDQGTIEYKSRDGESHEHWPVDTTLDQLMQKIKE